MKKLVDIENIFITNQKHLLPQNTVFYSYLIKDNYSKELLNDFKNYYTTNIAVSSDSFVNKFSSFISNNKLEFEITGGEMPYGGLYRVEINISNIDESTNSLFSNNTPLSSIKIILTPIEKAKNYNPFFQTPLNGSLMGQNKNYGTGISNLLSLNNKITLESSTSSFNQISVVNSGSLSDLQQGKTLIFDSSLNRLYLLGSQPNPLTMTLISDTGKIEGKYSIVGDNSSTMSANNWYLTGSSMGGRDCVDFENSTNKWFTPSKANDDFILSWDGTKKGTIILSTTFFSPKIQNNFLRVVPKNSQTILKGSQASTNNNQVFLDYLTSKGENDFDNLEGIFNKVRNEEMCISNNDEDILVIWWNPEYLNRLSREVYSGQYRCN